MMGEVADDEASDAGHARGAEGSRAERSDEIGNKQSVTVMKIPHLRKSATFRGD
jgi:hypothetical protein